MEAYARKTEQLLELSEDKLKEDLSVLDDCISAQEKFLKELTKPPPFWEKIFGVRGGFFEGVGLANCGQVVTNYLEGKDLIEYQARSAWVWAKATLHACGHYHHMVGPAMIANAKIAEKRGNTQRVREICRAVFQDFIVPLEYCERSEYRISEDDEEYETIRSLEYAVDMLITLDAANAEYLDTKERIERIWSKPRYRADDST